VWDLACFIGPDQERPKSLAIAPLFHITGLGTGLTSIMGGQSLYFVRRWDAGKILTLIENEKLTRIVGVPTMIKDLLDHPEFRPERIKSLKLMASGGSATPEALQKQTEKVSPGSNAQGYGLTETCGGVIFNKGPDAMKFPTSCGKALPFVVQVQIRSVENNSVVKDGERGELCIRSPMNMTRYHKRPEDTAKALDEDGWFRTGDVAKLEGGFVFILDRLKDLINRGGEKIDSIEVEAALYKHAAVRECSVFALPDERLGEVVGAAIWAEQDNLTTPITADMIRKHCVDMNLAAFKIPEGNNIFFVSEQLPKGATGKIDKKSMREHYATNRNGS